ncbi:MAG: glycosyltransferase family 39 protein [Chloroflexi bacterium]|nr:glycosyltransferase family 39 protein [Chloroflexota bacterium]
MTRAVWILLLTILLCAIWLRVAWLDAIPPGLYHDEAFSGLDALGILNGAGFPIFFEGNGGREPFFIYAHALSLMLFGASPWSLRIPAAFVGVLTLAAFFALARAMTPGKRSTWVALVGTAGLAVSYWHLNFSRMGWRTISLPLFATLAFYFFWCAWRTQKTRDHILAGLFLGASLYTYLSARFLPIVIALFWLTEWFISLRAAKRRNTQPLPVPPLGKGRDTVKTILEMTTVVASALVVFAPLGYYFATHPSAFLFRVGDVALAGGTSDLVANAWRVAQMFFARGDAEWRHGIAYRPVLDWFTGIPFALGLLGALWQWRQPAKRFALIWFVLLLVPTILSQDAPDTQRAIGALPAMFVFVAWGWEMIATRWSPQRALALGTLVTLLGSGAWSARDYFLVWANHPRAYYDYQGDLVELAKWIMTRDENVIVPFETFAHPTIQFLIRSRSHSQRTLPSRDRTQLESEPALAMIPSTLPNGGLILLRGQEAIWLNPMITLTALNNAQTLRDQYGKVVGSFWRTDESTRKTVLSYPASRSIALAHFDNGLSLFGTIDSHEITPGKTFPLGLLWETRAPIQSSVKMFAHILDVSGNPVGGTDTEMFFEYPLALLPRDLTLPARYDLKVNAGLPPGKYMLEIGLFSPAQNARVPVEIDGKRAEDDRVLFGPLKVKLNVPIVTPARASNARFGDAITLVGFDAASQIKRGEELKLTWLWQSNQFIRHDYTVFVHLLDNTNRIVAQTDVQPRGGTYPTSIWDGGELVADEIAVTIPADAPRGKYRIEIGWYDAQTGERLPTQNGDSIVLGEVSVE